MKESSYFLPYQIRWLKDDSKIKVWDKSRRIGATYVQSYEDTRDAATGAVPSVWFSSADESAAREYIKYVEDWARLLNFAAKELGEVVIDKDKDIKALSVEFANGVRINALTSNPKRFRSKGGKIVLDEFAHHEDQEELWRAAKPCTMWGYPLRILSTHNGVCLFSEFIEDIDNGKLNWSLHRTPIHLAVKEGIVKKIFLRTHKRLPTPEEEQQWLEDERKDCRDKITWLQEYCCIVVKENLAFLTYEMISKQEKEDILYIPLTKIENVLYTEKEIRENKIPMSRAAGKIFYDRELEELLEPLELIVNPLYTGMDIAETGHLSCIWVTEKIGTIKYTRAVIVMHKVGFSVQELILFKILEHPKSRGCIDKTGIGANIGQNALKKFGKFRVEPIHFSNPVSNDLATNLYMAFEDHSFFIPEDEEIREDLHSIKKFKTGAGNVRFDTDSAKGGKKKKKKTGNSHGDRFWAASLSNYASLNTPGDTNVTSRGKRKSKKITRGYHSMNIRNLRQLY